MPNKRKELKIEGANLWYLVGLITTDGCLSSDCRHIDITSKDHLFLKQIKNTIDINNKITVKYNSKKQESFHIQIANKNFYDFLLSIGLTPKKSLTLGEIKVPGQYFVDFLRGLIDGDGCIRRWLHSSNNKEQWSLRIYSGSETFINWLQNTAMANLKVNGRVHKNGKNLWVLKFGKMSARIILDRCYYENALALERKEQLAKICVNSYKGWKVSKTLLCN